MSGDSRGLLEGNTKASKLLNDEYKQVKEFDQEEGWEEIGEDIVIIDSTPNFKESVKESDDFQLIGLDTETPIFRASSAFYKLKPGNSLNTNLIVDQQSSYSTHNVLRATPITVQNKESNDT
ncbi:hypothetical protein WALSEDRAFT_62362 [Wallemia mellicola CBS 633.66]|uniref:Transcription factor TFIIIC triple barrel domain-containing protein n=1 Tax=Wallemia mellicola (strain ATCC MYA-4683 / CBS 633.66) TaxID=671144 RepID=I4YIA2_WALMC|nr:hypothetical protein WALSEDRAFT_62362 [Wallemia mellicola CBS 633.66]EIM23694.1 hypothetical protein WALSEDRAFT_62362 [Wallemia mellicola CBS 633.66]|eukprot:XP_006956360.1 hypothetical protein WALSEDRAFT_62362 [Wallemia mellicola CBS 633.66]